MRLRRGFGTVRKLTGNRRNGYAVHPPKVNGIRPKAICYVDDYHVGVCCLNAWHNGKYYRGLELDLKERKMDEIVSRSSCTFQSVYELFWDHKFGESAARKLSTASRAGVRSAWLKLENIWCRNMDEVTIMELQEIVNRVGREYSRSTTNRVITLIKGLYRFAVPRELCRKETGIYVETPKVKEEKHHAAFTDDEIEKLWSAADSEDEQKAATVRMILTMIYSGFRISAWIPHGEYEGMKVEDGVFIGGVKTDAGRDRIVPIHSGIQPLVEEMKSENGRGGFLCGKSESQFRRDFRKVLIELGIDRDGKYHTPHSCRHTFHRLLERAGVSEADRKRLMGHSLKTDVTNGVYGHRSVDELRVEIEKIQRVVLKTVA